MRMPRTVDRFLADGLAVAALLIATAGNAQAAANTAGEAKCHAALTKAIASHATAVTKAMVACRNAVLDGSIPGPCPDVEAQDAIDKSAAKVLGLASKKCQSTCDASSKPCIGDLMCPPNGTQPEKCTAVGKNFFDLRRMGFPGAFCESLIGGRMQEPRDFGLCAAALGVLVSDEFMETIYGDLSGAPPLSEAADDCLAAIVKSAPKLASGLARTVGKCRGNQLTSSSPTVNPDLCASDDDTTSSKVLKSETKFADVIADKCSDAAIAELDLCGNGIGGTPDVATAQTCLGQALRETAYSVQEADTRPYATLSIVNGAYPDTAPARCGDGFINQPPSQFLLLGEECDGVADDACPGECLAPGDTFECTCSNVLRARSFASGPLLDLDTGWSGLTHDAQGTQGTGTISTLSGCDCDQFGATPETGATCVGVSGDSECDVSSEVEPRCARRLGDGISCDEAGDQNGFHTQTDCWSCDDFASNAGDYCTGVTRRCLGGANSGIRCHQPVDCPGGACSGTGVCLDGPLAGDGCTTNLNCGLCVGGSNAGLGCGVSSNCPGGSCDGHACAISECIGGANPGDPCGTDADCSPGRCARTTDCLSQCYDEANTAQGPCWRQSDCADGQTCRGRCDTTDARIVRNNGAPLPLAGGGTSTCVVSTYVTNISGTRDLVSGQNTADVELRSFTYLADELNSRPCPVCGGYCSEEAGSRSGAICQGNCSGPEAECRFGANIGASCVDNADCAGSPCLAVACRFDSDCPSGTCSGDDSPECAGMPCRLDLTCRGGANEGEACRVESYTNFGTTSVDCLPNIGTNLSGTGLAISWTPLTSEVVTLDSPAPCDAIGYENFDCFCADGTGTNRSKPNSCEAACNDPDPAYYGRPCSALARCVGGSENGAACDADADCSGGGSCTNDPTTCGAGSTGVCSVSRCAGGSNAGAPCILSAQCTAGTCASSACTVGDSLACASGADGACYPAACSTNGDCDGSATCEDTCPSGRCGPLCSVKGVCGGGERDGFGCVVDSDCASGGTCLPDDEHEGACAVGYAYHCDGAGKSFVGCADVDLGTKKNCEYGSDGVPGNADDFIGAGTCVRDLRSCYVNDGTAEGGDVFNGNGDPTDSYQVAIYCISSSGNGSVDAVAGLPGPGRIRTRGVQVVNRDATP